MLTVLDLATELDPIPLERAVNDADKRGLIDPEALREQLARYGGQPGVRPLRLLLDKLFFQLSDSDLEIYFRRIVRAAELPMPLSKLRFTHYEVRYEPGRVRAALARTIDLLRHRIRL